MGPTEPSQFLLVCRDRGPQEEPAGPSSLHAQALGQGEWEKEWGAHCPPSLLGRGRVRRRDGRNGRAGTRGQSAEIRQPRTLRMGTTSPRGEAARTSFFFCGAGQRAFTLRSFPNTQLRIAAFVNWPLCLIMIMATNTFVAPALR